MATYSWLALANGEDVAFDPLVDAFDFDDPAISAAAVLLDLSVPGETAFSHGGKSITLLVSPATLAAANFTFAGGGQLLIGDNTTATASDSAANSLTGTAGNDQLIGLGGNDTLVGGEGNDTYVVRPTASAGASGIVFISDVVTEGAGAGSDTVYSSSSYTLPANVENLVLTGAPFWRAYTGTGNDLDNAITGVGDARQRLFGEGGADTLDGGGGKDTLDGGADDDVLIYDASDASINGGAGTDTLRLDGSGVTVDLTAIVDTVIQNIEVIDLTGTGDNSLTLDSLDVLNFSDISNTLRVDGDVGDVLNPGGGWSFDRMVNDAGETYAQFTQGAAVLQADADLDHGLDFAVALSGLDGADGFQISGAAAGDRSGVSVSVAGDVNGDGFDDLVVGAWAADPNAFASGASYVVFGQASGFSANLDLSTLNGANGFMIEGEATNDQSGRSVSAAGDVNGDGFSDLLIGAVGRDTNGNSAGASYVVFGQASGFSANLNLWALNGANGFEINGEAAGDYSGLPVAAAGDVNGDGFADLLIGAFGRDTNGKSAGASYVVFGQASGFSANLGLSALDGANGFEINGEATYDDFGRSVSAAGDVNGDGFADLLTGAFGRDTNGNSAGASYVIFGQASGFGANLDLSTLNGANGFEINGEAAGDQSGNSVSAAGDVNGDGFADLVIGAKYADPNGDRSGGSYVVFGQASGFSANLDLSALNGANGFEINGEATGDVAGVSVSETGDVNGDGFDDLLIGAFGRDINGNYAGASYVIFGQASGFSANLDLSALNGANGFEINGEAADDESGLSVAAAGDVNGDGFADLVIGAKYADPNGDSSGASYVLFGGDLTGAVDFQGTAGVDAQIGTAAAEAFVAGQGDDTLTGGGGADVFRGGEGDDRVVVSDTGFFDVDGGTGSDTLALDGSGIMLDLTLLADSKLTGVEIIDLTGGGNNTLTLDALEVLNLSDASNTLRVDGNAGDAVDAGELWLYDDNIDINGQTYAQYHVGNAVLQVDVDVDRSGLAALELSVLDGVNGFRLDGIDIGDQSGISVASAGDVNGDGFADIIIGAWGADVAATSGEGESYVVFGGPSLVSSVDLSALNGANGYRLVGIDTSDESGCSVASAGDVNGDGFADIIIGAKGADVSAGESYVVFGASSFASSVNLGTLNGINGFRLDGFVFGSYSGCSVSSAGDVNGDGFADVIVGAWRYIGDSYVVFGGSSFSSSMNLSDLSGTDGFRLDGDQVVGALDDRSGFSVASAGDVNGDGFADLIVGAYAADPSEKDAAGESYVVFGTSNFASSVSLSALDGTNGFRLTGIAINDRSGTSVASAGDVNGDGFADLIIGAVGADSGGHSAGASYVVFGGASLASSVDLGALNGANGFRLDGVNPDDNSGRSVASTGDVNGDGYSDLIVGADKAGYNDAGESYVVFGNSSFASSIDLGALNGTNGFRLNGVDPFDTSGFSVASAGDVNGDGFADLIIGAKSAYADGKFAAGESYVVFGADFTVAVDFPGTAGNDTLDGGAAAQVFVAGEGNDTLIGGGGTDVFRGGEGDDRIVVSDTGFFNVDGGTGSDTLALDGSGITLDLSAIADSKLTSIEVIDLTGSGNNTLALTTLDVLNLSEVSNTLRVDGNAGDAVNSTAQGWVAGGTVEVFPSVFYQSYTDGAATLLLDPDIIAASTIN